MVPKNGDQKLQLSEILSGSRPQKSRRIGNCRFRQTCIELIARSLKYTPEKKLPPEILLQIIRYLRLTDVLNFRLVCKYFSVISFSSVFRSVTLLLPGPKQNEACYPLFYTGIFNHLANEVTIITRTPLKSSTFNVIALNETGILSTTTSILKNLSKITLDLTGFEKTKSLYYGSFFVKFFSALYSDPDKEKIRSIVISSLPLWVLQMLRQTKPEVLHGALSHVKQLYLSFISILLVDVNDTMDFYQSSESFTAINRNQLHTAYDAVRALLISAKNLEEFEFLWFSTECEIGLWKAFSPIGDLTSLCKPAAGADAARFMFIGRLPGGTSWVDNEGNFTMIWQSLRILKLSKLITCARQLSTAILGAKNTLNELELSEILLNKSCGDISWNRSVIMPLLQTMVIRNGQEKQFRLQRCTLSYLGYTSEFESPSSGILKEWIKSLIL